MLAPGHEFAEDAPRASRRADRPESDRVQRRVLMVAFHFPPLAVSSGIQRTLRFVQHLPSEGWQPLVLTAHPRAYWTTSADLLGDVPADAIVHRAWGLDTARHLSIRGRYPALLARPDRWLPWALGAIPAGLRLIREHRPDVIWSTYPIATALLIAHRLHRLSGVPLVADFRDPMAQEGYPEDPRTWRSYVRIEQAVARDAARLVFVTPSARALYRTRYRTVPDERFALIENGFDEQSFVAAEAEGHDEPLSPGRITLLHSGVVYPSERDPSALIAALGRLKRSGRVGADGLRMRFRAPVHDVLLRRLALDADVEDIVEILPSIGYRQALAEMLRADGLMVLQAANCNEQIPAKLYEYFRARRPLLGLADPEGDTGRTLLDEGVTDVVPLEDTARIEHALLSFIDALRTRRTTLPSAQRVAAMARRARARQLATILEDVRVSAPTTRT
jgi:glycosyltransferase involved in cell wall biosynthesis